LRELGKVARANRRSPISTLSEAIHDLASLSARLKITKKCSSIYWCEAGSNISACACTGRCANNEIGGTRVPADAFGKAGKYSSVEGLPG
jgi:hypothetical protein